jgi:hypothetical protein
MLCVIEVIEGREMNVEVINDPFADLCHFAPLMSKRFVSASQ